ncbi:MAG: hypothetical protein U0930_10580 [Pirellulales bacterium]
MRTRLCTLDPITRQACASDFFGESHVPLQAATIEAGRTMASKHVLLKRSQKANMIAETLEGGITDRVPASCTEHSDARR